MDLVTYSQAEVIRFAIVLTRVGGLMVFTPFFGSLAIPHPIRVSAALVITLVMVPSLPLAAVPSHFGLAEVLTSLCGEIMFGLLLGLTANFVFAGLQLAGQVISFQLGFSIINLIDPTSEVESSVFSLFENIIGVLFFLLLNGHHWFLTAVSDSFSYLPPAGVHISGPMAAEVIRLSSSVLKSGVQIAGPILAVTVVTDVALGIIGRAAPHLNILVVGMPLKTLVGLGCLSLSFYYLPQYLGVAFSSLHSELLGLLSRLR
jgi:flagellar biosynthetic protein FliR